MTADESQDASREAAGTAPHRVQGAADRTRRRDAALGQRLLRTWRRLSAIPGGSWAFSRMLGRVAPYSGTIGARVVVLEPGRAVLALRDRRRVRNHLRSVHAIALANLGELASGLAVMAAMPPGVRGIPTSIRIDYLKKARGELTATGTGALPAVHATTAVEAWADIVDDSGDVVAITRVTWTLEPVA